MRSIYSAVLTVIAAAVLTACGGGGSNTLVRTSAPAAIPTVGSVSAPQLIGTMSGLVANSIYGASNNAYTTDLTGNGTQNVVLAGGIGHNATLVNSADAANWVNSKMSVYGWSGGNLVDQTSQWFSGTDNVIIGTPKVSFGNFAGNNKQSLFVAPGTDGILSISTAQMFVNDGSKFTRFDVALPQPLDSTDSATFAFNGVDNVLALGYPYSEVIMGSTSNNFRAYAVSGVSGSSVASGNFLGTGAPSFVITDSSTGSTLNAQPNNLFGFSQDPLTGAVTMNLINSLPVPLFNMAPYFSTTAGSNAVKVVKFDFDGSGVDSVFILSMPNNYQTSQYLSSIQFLKNNGAGVFTDVTSTTVSGYNMMAAASTTPTIIDLLNKGLPDIVLPSPGATQVLMQVSKGKFVASMANTITDFGSQVGSLLTNGQTSQNGTITFVRGPSNNLYLLNMVPMTLNGFATKSYYLSQVSGNSVALSAQGAITAARTIWPTLTDSQLNAIITATGSNFYGVTVLDPAALLAPIGNLMMPTSSGRFMALNGYINGINANSALQQLKTVDQYGRDFNVNLQSTVGTQTNLWGRSNEMVGQQQISGHSEYLVTPNAMSLNGVRVGSDLKNFTLGTPAISVARDTTMNMQYTSLSFNPWLQFGGVYGTVNASSITELVTTYKKENFTAQLGLMYNATNITAGLVTKVNDMFGAWSEVGYRDLDTKGSGFGFYAGIKPVMLNGRVEANLPTSVDASGNIMYTKTKLTVQNPIDTYLRLVYTDVISKHLTYVLGGMIVDNRQYRAQLTARFSF